MIKKNIYYITKKKNKLSLVTRVYYDKHTVRRTKISLLGIPVYIKDEVVRIEQDWYSK